MTETTLAKPVQLRMGDDVPEWLLVIEPMTADSPRGNFRFSIDVQVVETPDYFVVVPQVLERHPPVIDTRGTQQHRIYAPAKPVHVIGAQEVFFPLDVNAWHNGQVGQPPITDPVQRDLEAEQRRLFKMALDDARRIKGLNFWQRLLWVAFGR